MRTERFVFLTWITRSLLALFGCPHSSARARAKTSAFRLNRVVSGICNRGFHFRASWATPAIAYRSAWTFSNRSTKLLSKPRKSGASLRVKQVARTAAAVIRGAETRNRNTRLRGRLQQIGPVVLELVVCGGVPDLDGLSHLKHPSRPAGPFRSSKGASVPTPVARFHVAEIKVYAIWRHSQRLGEQGAHFL